MKHFHLINNILVKTLIVLLSGAALYFGGLKYRSLMEDEDRCYSLCDFKKSKILNNKCHCKTSHGWIEHEFLSQNK